MSNKDLEEQESEIKRKLFYVAVPIIIMLAIIIIYQNNSLDFSRRQYSAIRNIEFGGHITKKKQVGDYPTAARYMYLNSNRKIRISNEIYEKIKIGDSASKSKGQDSAYYYLANGEILIEDRCEFLREKFVALKKKEVVIVIAPSSNSQ
jgi:hypothetical protein